MIGLLPGGYINFARSTQFAVPPPARPDGACNGIVIHRPAAEDGRPSLGQRAAITVCEEVFLLTLDCDTGRPSTWLSARSLRIALSGTLLMDLALADGIDTDLDGLFVVDPAPIGEPVLERALSTFRSNTIAARCRGCPILARCRPSFPHLTPALSSPFPCSLSRIARSCARFRRIARSCARFRATRSFHSIMCPARVDARRYRALRREGEEREKGQCRFLSPSSWEEGAGGGGCRSSRGDLVWSDNALACIVDDGERRPIDRWVGVFAEDRESVRPLLIEGLAKRGIVLRGRDGALLVMGAHHYRDENGRQLKDARRRLAGVLLSGEVPGPRDIMIVSLADSCALWLGLLEESARIRLAPRIGQIARMDLIGQAVARAIRSDDGVHAGAEG